MVVLCTIAFSHYANVPLFYVNGVPWIPDITTLEVYTFDSEKVPTIKTKCNEFSFSSNFDVTGASKMEAKKCGICLDLAKLELETFGYAIERFPSDSLTVPTTAATLVGHFVFTNVP